MNIPVRYNRVDNLLDKTKQKKFASTDILPDIQNQNASVDVSAGISNFRTLFESDIGPLFVNFSISVSTQNTRGVHMSRLIKSTLKHTNGRYIEDSLIQIHDEITKTQPDCLINVKFQYPVHDQFLDTSITLNPDKKFDYDFKLTGITSCPCSKAIAGVGHMQRTILTLKLQETSLINFEEVALNLNECFSASLKEFLNRADEANKIIEAQDNSKFVEDVVRDCLKKFPNAKYIHAQSLESIHSHDAIASWPKNSNN